MAEAFECDLCKKLVKNAHGSDVFYPRRIKISVSYQTAVNPKPLDLCWDCRAQLLKSVIVAMEAKAKYTWSDLKDPKKLEELLGGQQ